MKNRIFSAIFFTLTGLLVAVGPQTIFKVCDTDMMVMKCFYSAQAELGIGGLIAVIGIALFFLSNYNTRAGLNIALIPAGILTALIPTVLIGVCGGEHMPCHKLTLPALVLLGVLIAVGAVANAVYLAKQEG